jgi:hypothetical protein
MEVMGVMADIQAAEAVVAGLLVRQIASAAVAAPAPMVML